MLIKDTFALLMGISSQRGVLCPRFYESSVNTTKFMEWLEALRADSPQRDICLFVDQLSVHRTHQSRETAAGLGIRIIYNVAYSPDYNPIETSFSKIKHAYKKGILRRFVQGIEPDFREVAAEAVQQVTLENVQNCVRSSMRLLGVKMD